MTIRISPRNGIVRAALVALIFTVGLAVACGGEEALQGPGDDTGAEEALAVSAGTFHTCALTVTGGVKCWGSNSNGQLGDGTPIGQRTTPADVVGLTSGVTAVSTGELHTCALTATGGVKCWGANTNGQLGDGTRMDRGTPVDVTGLTSGVAAMSAGTFHTCALTTAGGLKCWGRRLEGGLLEEPAPGDRMTTERTTPVDVVGLTTGVVAVSAGTLHTCALTATGGLKCWGYNREGQLGDGTTTDRGIPVDVTGLTSGVAAVSAGWKHTCAVTTAGGLKCWGWNRGGQIGDETTTDRTTPVDVTDLTGGVAAVSAGRSHTCALTTAGGVKCWGLNDGGQLGNRAITRRNTPVDVASLTSGVAAISAGLLHTCALTVAGGLKCWGFDGSGQLGNGAPTQHRIAPVDVAGLAGR